MRPGDDRSEVEREKLLVFEPFGDVSLNDAVGDPFRDCGLADAGLADEDRVVLRAAREHLHHPTNLFVSSDHRVGLALPCSLGQVVRVLLEGLELSFRIRVGHTLVTAHLLNGL